MASSSKAHDGFNEETDDEEEEVEGFDDFTIASSWERFISEIEAVCRLWLIDGPENLMEKGADPLGASSNLYKVKTELQYNTKSYCLEYYFEINTDGKVMEWNDGLHILQLSFGVKNFLVIAPISVSGVVLDAPEASKLLSATAIALSNCCSTWPAFVPVHDPSRKAYMGIQNLGTIFTRRFEADRIGSQVPIKLMHLEGLYELFVSKFALSTVEFSMSFFNVRFTMKLTYRTPSDDDENDIQGATESSESDGKLDGLTRSQAQWDDACPWAEWYSVEDPIKGFELITIWSSKMVESSLEMAELENVSALEADKWLLFPLLSTNMTDDSKGNTIGFTSQLCLLVNAFHTSFEAQFIEDFVSAEKVGADTLRSSTIVPPPTVLDRVLKDLFHEGDQISNYGKEEHINSHFIKGAPLPSLFAQFCLHSLWFGNCNIRAISVLWIEFVREVRWCWEESQPLPRMLNNGSIDLSTCLIHQKLQMLSICIAKKSQLDEFHDCDESKSPAINGTEEGYYDAEEYQNQSPLHKKRHDQMHDSTLLSDDQISKKRMGVSPSKSENVFASPNMAESRRGSAGIVQSTMLLKSPQKMHAPYTQDAPLMTEDMHEERLHAAETFGDAFSFSGQLEKDILSSDMSAFKAANPGAVFEDFIRWHSPGDWESEETSKNGSFIDDEFGAQNTKWPPSGRLSQRMSEQGNSWRKIWNDSPALAVFEQKPLIDPNKEGEKILHYLETLKPHQLIEQMVCTAFRASADTLSLTSFGNLKQLRTKIGQLYLTIASTLKPLGANYLHDDELIDDLKRLCLVFEHIEKLVTLAASMHRRLLNVPRLYEAIFSDYFNFYIPKMGTSSTSICYEKEFNIREPVRTQERLSIENMFTPPTANQSWRKVLSMGNLLNGHEPTLREIVLSVHDSMSGNHYGTGNTQSTSDEIETHRMYIRGTSNDLQVALSVTSCD